MAAVVCGFPLSESAPCSPSPPTTPHPTLAGCRHWKEESAPHCCCCHQLMQAWCGSPEPLLPHSNHRLQRAAVQEASSADNNRSGTQVPSSSTCSLPMGDTSRWEGGAMSRCQEEETAYHHHCPHPSPAPPAAASYSP